jgi:hypothetical protein
VAPWGEADEWGEVGWGCGGVEEVCVQGEEVGGCTVLVRTLT